MDLKKILAISGYPGLYKMVSQARGFIVVESLETKKRKPAYATHKISSLADIAVYTDKGEVELGEIFRRMHKHLEGGPAPSHKANKEEIEAFFFDFLPEYDEDRVYASDMKRMLQWYNILQKLDMLHFEEAEENPTGEGDETDKEQGQESPEADKQTGAENNTEAEE